MVVDSEGAEQVLGEFDGRYLSTEVAGGFTGRVLAIEALDGPILVDSVSYHALAPEPAAVASPEEIAVLLANA